MNLNRFIMRNIFNFSSLLGGIAVFLLLQTTDGKTQNLPPLTTQIYDTSASAGYYFCVPYKLDPPYDYDHSLTILDNYGRLVYYNVNDDGGLMDTPVGFMIQSNGMMSYFSVNNAKYYIMDSTFTVIDSISAVNGYGTDPHEMRILTNGHYLLLAIETMQMDLSSYSWFGPNHNLPGSSEAQVLGSVIQEFDENKNLIFEWRAFDHFNFQDVDSVWLNSPTIVDWTHSNALEMDFDGNILLSSRHLNEITKINRQNGSVIWRLGGKNNQFDFINDNIGFTGQHDIRRKQNGNITLWDNGQYTTPPVARALEYQIDETQMTVNLVWEFINDINMYSAAMGNVQQLTNGNRLIDFGFAEPEGYPLFSVVKPDYSKVLEVFAPEGYGSYRAFNYQELPWELQRPEITCEEQDGTFYLVAEPGHPEYHWTNGATTQSIEILYTGDYQVFVPYGDNGYLSSEIFTVTNIDNPCDVNSIGENKGNLKNDITVFPNPSYNENIIVSALYDDVTISKCILYDIYGNLVLCENMKGYEKQLTLETKDIASGKYILKVNYNNVIATFFIVICN